MSPAALGCGLRIADCGLPQKGTKSTTAASRNQKRWFGQDTQDLQDKARTKPLSFGFVRILFNLFILSISFRK